MPHGDDTQTAEQHFREFVHARTAALSRGAALLLGVSSILTIGAGQGGNSLGPIPLVVTSLGFALGWFMLGINAVRLDRPASEARPA